MLNNKDSLLSQLQELDLNPEEAIIYLELLNGPSTHLQLSRDTGVNRTKVYRIIDQLAKKSLVTHRRDDRGVFLIAVDPSTLEVGLVTQEEKLKQQRATLRDLIPQLSLIHNRSDRAFTVRTYDGQAGLKQMCWHELKTQGELVTLGNGTIEQIVTDNSWAAKHRERHFAARYRTREIINYEYGEELPELSDAKLQKSGLYIYRMLPPSIVEFDNQTVIYNDTVAIYHWKHDQKVGVEIISDTYAHMMRQIFQSYWEIAKETER